MLAALCMAWRYSPSAISHWKLLVFFGVMKWMTRISRHSQKSTCQYHCLQRLRPALCATASVFISADISVRSLWILLCLHCIEKNQDQVFRQMFCLNLKTYVQLLSSSHALSVSRLRSSGAINTFFAMHRIGRTPWNLVFQTIRLSFSSFWAKEISEYPVNILCNSELPLAVL